MRPDALHVENLRVERLYGIRHDGVATDELATGINVIYGANGRGKTTFGRAVQGVVWPGFLKKWRPTISGAFSYGGARWTIDLEDGRIRYQREGADSQPSALPDESHRERYWLSLHELLDRDTGKSFADQIRDLALGGQNVAEAARRLDYSIPTGRPGAITNRLNSAVADLERVRREQEDLRRRERGLLELERQRDEAETAGQRVQLIERVIELNRVRRAAEEAQAALEELPEILTAVRDDDAERIEQSLKDEQAAIAQRDDANRRRQAAEEGLAANLIAVAGRPEVNVSALKERQRTLADLERALIHNTTDVAKSEAEESTAWGAIGAEGHLEPAADLTPETLRAIDRLVEAHTDLLERDRALKALRDVLGDEAGADLQAEMDRLTEGVRTLGDWLREARAAEDQSPLVFPLAAGAAALFILAGVIATLLWHPAAILALAAGVVLAVIASIARRRSGDHTGLHEEQFLALTLDPPRLWTIPDVRNLQRGLETRRANIAVRIEKAQRREAASPKQDELERDREELDRRTAAIADELGLDAPMSGSQLVTFARNLAAWQNCRRERTGLERAGEELRKQLDAELEAFNQAVEALSLPDANSASIAAGQVDTIGEAQKELERLDQEVESARRDLKVAGDRAAAARSGIRSICERLKIDEEGAQTSAQSLCDQLEDYRERRRVSGEKLAVADRLQQNVEANPAFSLELLEEDEDGLERMLGHAREQAGSLGRVLEEIGAIRREVEKAQQEHDLERALAEHEEAVEALRRDYDAACAQSIGRLLADYVEEESRETQLPPVFRRARELFAEFTRSRYELRFDGSDAGFWGFDTVLDRGFQLDELSSGTRLQLLLAVRIAFVEQLEQGCKLPLLLDEALANSDDERAEAIIEAVIALCRQGRQVFYFTAQDDEVLKWKRALGTHRDIGQAFIALPGGADIEVDSTSVPAAPIVHELPPLDGHSRQAYGQLLKVPRWSGWEPVGALHLWYLEPRLERLQPLLAQGFERWGQLASLTRDNAIEMAGYDQSTIAPLTAKARALEVWQELWRIGRGKKVDREALEASDAVSGRFIDDVSTLCLKFGGDGRQVLDALEGGQISGFRSNKTEDLEAFLLYEGYIEEVPPMSDGDIRAEVLGRMKADLDAAGLTRDDLDAFFEDIRLGPGG